MYQFILRLFISCLIAGQVMASDTMTYNSSEYLNNQYDIVRLAFSSLDVSKTKDNAIKITIPTDYGFTSGQYQLKRPIKDALKKFALFLNTYRESTVRIIGFTDSVGNAKYNKALGLNRAKAVEQVLLNANVSPYRLNVFSEGEELPKCTNKTSKGKECNRRVEMLVSLENHLEF